MEEGRKRHRSSAGKDINDLPVEVIGAILSHLTCVRYVAMACMTCRTWRDAVKHHLYKITCRLPISEARKWKNYECTITGVVMQTTCLRELCIYNGRIRAGSLLAWLLHTRKTLKSFTFMSTTRTRVNILEKLAGVENSLERLVWGYAYVPTLNLTIRSLPYLVSLNLHKVAQGLDTVENIQQLFSLFPKLEIVSLTEIVVKKAPSRVVLNISSSLKTLNMERLFFDRGHPVVPIDTTLVLCADSLSYLSLISLSNNKELMSVEVEQVKSLQHLIIRDVNIVRLRLGDSLEHLVIWNAHIKHLEVKNLKSLFDLKLFMEEDSRAMWPSYTKIICKASTKLSKLQLLGGLPTFTVEDLDTIASSFPRLCWLSLYHQNTLFGNSPRKLRVFRQLFDLELYVNNKVTNHDLFGAWILKFLECCPNLKRLGIKLEPRSAISWAEEIEFPRKLASLLKELMRPYPHVDVRFDTVHTQEILKIFSQDNLQRHMDTYSSLVVVF